MVRYRTDARRIVAQASSGEAIQHKGGRDGERTTRYTGPALRVAAVGGLDGGRAHVETSATPPPAAAPIPKPGPPVDAAAGAVAAGCRPGWPRWPPQLARRVRAAGDDHRGRRRCRPRTAANDSIKGVIDLMGKGVSGLMSAGANLFSSATSVGTGSVVAPMPTLSTALKPMANVTTKLVSTPLRRRRRCAKPRTIQHMNLRPQQAQPQHLEQQAAA